MGCQLTNVYLVLCIYIYIYSENTESIVLMSGLATNVMNIDMLFQNLATPCSGASTTMDMQFNDTSYHFLALSLLLKYSYFFQVLLY